ncbi:hypothetical protein EJ06DRAFT_24469 [Trichodelitschia bisporula]|uniref:Uncharacterized protein n=1 Tax=Trichodelitschia bisporula TaxID=703511 RepID=A0A6G1IBJ2_9PEZI|nr:hypothetical protein EJ06DRAFT_24469 [Trichodelitschia bisporula]
MGNGLLWLACLRTLLLCCPLGAGGQARAVFLHRILVGASHCWYRMPSVSGLFLAREQPATGGSRQRHFRGRCRVALMEGEDEAAYFWAGDAREGFCEPEAGRWGASGFCG